MGKVNEMQVIFLNVNDNKAPEKLNIKDDLQSYYNLLECNTIDIVRRKIGKRYFNIVCDDEGALLDRAKISAVSNLGDIRLVGNLIICAGDITEDGDLIGLTDDQAEYVKQHIEFLCTRQNPEGYYILTQCEY
jgi:hypothetical protein